MRTRDALERLAAVAPAAPSLDAGEEDGILDRIFASGRPNRSRSRRPIAVVLVAALVVGTAIAAVATRGHAPSAAKTRGHRHVALTGARIQMAGYHFRTPAGFEASNVPCNPSGANAAPDGSNGFAAAASAEGGCVEVAYLIASSPSPAAATATPAGQPVEVGSYQAYYDSQADSGESTLYVALPKADPSAGPVYLVLIAQDLTEDQLIAVAQSGLPANP